MTMRLFQPYDARRSDWFGVASDRTTWWAIEMRLTHDLGLVEGFLPGRLAGRLWPEGSPGAVYLATDLAAWALLFRHRVLDPAFPADALPAWSERLVGAFADGYSGSEDGFARSLGDLRRRWPEVCDESRFPAATVELGRFLDAVRFEAEHRDGSGRDLDHAVEMRALSTGLPLLLTSIPAELVPGLGLRDSATTRQLVRAAATHVAWITDLIDGEAEGSVAPPNVVAALAVSAGLNWDEAMSAGIHHHDEACRVVMQGIGEALEAADEDVAWLGRTLSDFVAGYHAWGTDRVEPPGLPWRPNPFVLDSGEVITA